jgi:hypothetical protein
MSKIEVKKCRLTSRLYATFFVRDKGIAKQFQRTKNVGGVSVGGAADLANGTPRALARAHTILLGEVGFAFIIPSLPRRNRDQRVVGAGDVAAA